VWGESVVAQKVTLPEARFLRALLPDELLVQYPTIRFTANDGPILEALRQHIDTVLSRLSYRDRGILEMRYGLGDGYAYTLAETGYVFRLTREKIRMLQIRSLKLLRREADGLTEFLRELSR
jgi:hypothetical protein